MQRGWTFGKKLAMGFSVVVGLMVLMAGSAWLGLDAAVGAKDRVIARTDQSLLKAKDLETSLARRVANARGYLLGGQARLLERTREEATISSRLLSELEAGAVDGEARNLLAEIREAQRLHVAAMDRLMAQRESQQDLATLADRFDDQTLPLHDQLSALVRKFARHESDANERVQRDAEAAVRQTRSWLLAAVLAAVLSALGIGLHLVGTLTRQIASTVSDLRSASTELQAAATQQATSSKEQATAVQESLTTMKELLVTSRQIGESATHVSEVARGTLDATRRGEELARSGRAGNTEIRSQMGRVVDLMVELGRKSRQIGTVLALVNELAEQTNILAVNATIEATAAGESGIRFGAVADEIRGLADRVTGATREIQVLVEEVRSTVNSTVMATETGSKSVDAGARQFDDFAAAFGRIAELVANTAEAAREIELSIAQQQTAVEQVNVAVADVSQAAQESAASARQTQATSTQLVGLAGELHALIQDQDRASA